MALERAHSFALDASHVPGPSRELVPSQPDGRAAMLLRRLWPGALFRIMERKARA